MCASRLVLLNYHLIKEGLIELLAATQLADYKRWHGLRQGIDQRFLNVDPQRTIHRMEILYAKINWRSPLYIFFPTTTTALLTAS